MSKGSKRRPCNEGKVSENWEKINWDKNKPPKKEKKCSKCKKTFAIRDYVVSKGYCRQCAKEYQAEYDRKSREARKAHKAMTKKEMAEYNKAHPFDRGIMTSFFIGFIDTIKKEHQPSIR